MFCCIWPKGPEACARIQALIPVAGEQGPPRWFSDCLSSEFPGPWAVVRARVVQRPLPSCWGSPSLVARGLISSDAHSPHWPGHGSQNGDAGQAWIARPTETGTARARRRESISMATSFDRSRVSSSPAGPIFEALHKSPPPKQDQPENGKHGPRGYRRRSWGTMEENNQHRRAEKQQEKLRLCRMAEKVAAKYDLPFHRGQSRRQDVDTLQLMHGLYQGLLALLVDVLDEGDKRAKPSRKEFIPRTLRAVEAISEQDLVRIIAAEKFAESGSPPCEGFKRLLRELEHLTAIPADDDPVWSVRWAPPSGVLRDSDGRAHRRPKPAKPQAQGSDGDAWEIRYTLTPLALAMEGMADGKGGAE